MRSRTVGFGNNSSSRKIKDESPRKNNDNERHNAVSIKRGERKDDMSMQRLSDQILSVWQPPTGEIFDINSFMGMGACVTHFPMSFIEGLLYP